jgi:uncharacterized protein
MLPPRHLLLALLLLPALPSAYAAAPIETPVRLTAGSGQLGGLLLSASQTAHAGVVIIPGSGPVDRDGNTPTGMRAGLYRLLAQGLAERGISSLRVDKRGRYSSATVLADANAVTIADYAADVQRWLQFLRRRTGNRCIWLLGHSEGALVALVAAQRRPDVCGLLLLASPGRPLGEVLRAQLKAQPANAPLLHPAMATIDALEAGRRVEAANLPGPLRGLFRPAVQGFLISAFAYDPARLLHDYKKPVLLLQGARDLQLTPEDAQLLAQSDPRAHLLVLPDVNHVMKRVTSDERAANLATYVDADLPLAPEVVRAVADFIDSAAHH